MVYNDSMEQTNLSYQYYNNYVNQYVDTNRKHIYDILHKNSFDLDINTIDCDKLATDIYKRVTDRMTLNEMYYLIADHCASLITHHPDYNKIASRICVDRLHLCTPENYYEVVSYLYNNIDKNNNKCPLVSEKLYNIVMNNKDKIQKILNFQNDYNFDYFGIRTLERSYLCRIYNPAITDYKKGEKIGQIIERPQHLIMRLALGIHGDNLDDAFETYNLVSQKYFTHATPTLFNAGTPRPQLSSCYLITISDNIEHIFQTISNTAFISKWAGGIGISLSHIRAKGSIIRGTNGNSEGVIPLCCLLDKLGKYINQGGKRNGSIACFCKDTEVFTVNDGVKKIQDVKIGDLVVTHRNRVKPVVQTHKNPLGNRKIYKLKTENGKDIYVTENHKFWSSSTKNSSLQWNSIKDLKNVMEKKFDCYISIPSATDIKNVKNNVIDVAEYQIKRTKIVSSNKIMFKDTEFVNRFWNIDENFASLLGVWLNCGNFTKRNNNTSGISFDIYFKANSDKNGIVNYISELSRKVFECNVTQCVSNKWAIINLDSHVVGFVFKKLFQKMELPNDIYSWPRNLVNSFIKGLTINSETVKENTIIHLPNKTLTNQIYHLCKNNGINVSFNGTKLNIPSIMSDKNKIISITETNRCDDFVYTLGVEDDHSYTVEGLIAENCYIEPWHADIYDFCELRKNTGDENLRARDLFLGLWVPDLFMKRVLEGGLWSLMCPDECPGLVDVYGEEFEKLYIEYENQKKYKRQVRAIDLWYHILECQIENGMPYMLYKDHANRKSNQKNLGTIKCSNLCSEIIEYTSEDEIAVCNLASICLPTFLVNNNGAYTYNFEKLGYVVRVCVRTLNKVIDINSYPPVETKKSNLKHRPIGIGVQGLADVFNIMEIPFGSDKARELNKQIFETMYYNALDESCELAKKTGKYESFDNSPFSQGLLQWNLWGLKKENLTMGYDWDTLIKKIKTHGTKNSLLTTIMPTASTSQIMGFSECIEPYMSNIYTRSTLAGEFSVINENLVKSLIKRNLWSDDTRKKIVAFKGSIQKIPEIPKDLKEIFKTASEVYQKDIITLSAERGPFIDQSQSLNLFIDQANFDVLTNCHLYSWECGLKTGMYYLRSRPVVDPIQFGIDIEELNQIIKENTDSPTTLFNMDEIEKLIKDYDTNNTNTVVCKMGKRNVDIKNCDVCSS